MEHGYFSKHPYISNLKLEVPGSTDQLGRTIGFGEFWSLNIPASSMKISTSSTVLGSCPVTCHQVQSQSVDQVTPQRNERMSPEKGPFQNESSSSNHQFSGNMLVFKGGIGKIHETIQMSEILQKISIYFLYSDMYPSLST